MGVLPAFERLSVSTDCVSERVFQLTVGVITSPDASVTHSVLTRNLDGMNGALKALNAALRHLTRAFDRITDGSGNLNIMNLGGVIAALYKVSAAEDRLTGEFSGMVSGIPSGSTAQPSDVARSLKETANAEEELAGSVENVNGIPAALLSVTAEISGVTGSLDQLSEYLHGLCAAFSSRNGELDAHSAAETRVVIRSLNDLAKAQADLAAIIRRLFSF